MVVDGNVWYLLKALPIIGLTAVFFTILGWKWRARRADDVPLASASASAHGAQVAELETALASAQEQVSALEAEAESLRSQLAEVTASDTATDMATAAPLEDEAESLRTALQEAQAEIRALQSRNARLDDSLTAALEQARDGGKSAQLKRFELESQLSKTREELTRLKAESANSGPAIADLQAELSQLRRSLTAATTAFGQAQRDREAARAALKAHQAKTQTELDLTVEEKPTLGASRQPDASARPASRNQPSPAAARQQAQKFAAAAAERRAKRAGQKKLVVTERDGVLPPGTEAS